MIQVESLEEARLHIESLLVRVEELERLVSDHAQRFDTLQTGWLKRLWFRIDGWPSPRRDLNADTRQWRPWH